MIHEIAPHVFHNQFLPGAEVKDDSLIFIFGKENEPSFGGGAVVVHGENLPVYKDLDFETGGELIRLFKIDDRDCFLLKDCDTNVFSGREGFTLKSFRDIRNVREIPDHEYFLSMTAFQLHNWYRNNAFCGRCGSATERDDKERAIVCPKCGNRVYPRIVPAVTVAIIDREKEKIVLTKYAGRDIPFFALVAGFTEIGETLEQTVEREVMEETGLKVKNIRYFGSQPWGIVDDLMVGFYCDLDGSGEIHRDESELKLADWFSRDEVVLQPTDLSLTNCLMRAFKEGRI